MEHIDGCSRSMVYLGEACMNSLVVLNLMWTDTHAPNGSAIDVAGRAAGK